MGNKKHRIPTIESLRELGFTIVIGKDNSINIAKMFYNYELKKEVNLFMATLDKDSKIRVRGLNGILSFTYLNEFLNWIEVNTVNA